MTEEKLKAALIQAHNKGDKEAAQLFASKIKELRAQTQPSQDAQGEPKLSMYDHPQQRPQQPERSIGDMAIGAGEALLTAATGATAGTAGSLIGTLEGIVQAAREGKIGESEAAQIIQQRAAELGGYVTAQPRSEAGQEYVKNIAEVAGMLPPTIAGVTGAQAAGMQQGLGRTAQLAAANIPAPQSKPQAMGGLSVGAAEAAGGLEAQRRERAASLPVEMKLTKGQATQDFAQQQFERETAKRPEEGAPIREFMNDQLRKAAMNMDAFLDETGTQLPDTAFRLQTGQKIDEALRKRAAADKARIRVAYKEAEKAGETSDPVDLSGVAQYLNDNRAEAGLAPIMQAVSKQLEVQGVGGGSLLDGTLQIGEMTLEQAERLRKSINKFSSGADANNLRVAAELKQLIDEATEGAGGEKYQIARKLRKNFADNYERTEIVKNILGNKRGSNDRKIALEDIVDKVVLNGSVEDLSNVRRLLQTQGSEGMSAWRELQAATIRSIRDEATSNIGQTPDGLPIISPAKLNKAIMRLDENGKLDKIFGKKGAERLKDLNATVKDAFVAQPNAVNNSNTSSAIFAALDMVMSAQSGVPAPILSGIKMAKEASARRKIEKRVEEALK